MLIEVLLNLIAAVLTVLFAPLHLEGISDEVKAWVLTLIDYIAAGAAAVAAYTDFSYLLVLFGICIAVDVVHTTYGIILWILRKIPFLGVS